MSKKQNIYVADFETCATNVENTEARVWAYCLMEVNSKKVVDIGGDINSFMKTLSNINGKVFFHNLKFDGSFILPWLLNNGFRQLTHKESSDRRYKKKSFELISDENNVFYGITIHWTFLNIKPKRRTQSNPFMRPKKTWITTTILDSLKLLPMSVEKMGSKFLNLPVDERKGKIDYVSIRKEGYIMTDEEKEYIIKDCDIVSRGIEKMHEKGLNKSTVSSCALQEFIRLTFDGRKDKFKRCFPVLLDKYDKDETGKTRNYDDFIRQSYKGGWTYVNPKFKNIRHKKINGATFDVNSLYPSVMLKDLMPFGTPIKFDGKYEYDKFYPLYIQELYIEKFELKPRKFPCIQIKGNSSFVETEYLSEGRGVKICVTNIDLQLIQECYNLYGVRFIGGLKFMSLQGIFNNYIGYYSDMKIQASIEGNQTLRELAKLLLNSLYGKFASKVDRFTMRAEFDKNGVVRQYKQLDDSYRIEPVYTALGTFITSYARNVTIRGALANYDTFMYADTDSLHLNIDEEEIEDIDLPLDLDNTGELGLWKLEMIFSDSLYLGAKKYMELNVDNDTWEVKCAGLPNDVKNTIQSKEHFYVGATFNGKKTRRVVKGGTLLIDSVFTIKK